MISIFTVSILQLFRILGLVLDDLNNFTRHLNDRKTDVPSELLLGKLAAAIFSTKTFPNLIFRERQSNPGWFFLQTIRVLNGTDSSTFKKKTLYKNVYVYSTSKQQDFSTRRLAGELVGPVWESRGTAATWVCGLRAFLGP